MNCPECKKGQLIEAKSLPERDVGRLLGLPSVLVVGAPGLSCEACGAVLTPGYVLDSLIPCLAAAIAAVSDLGSSEARFLRKTLGLTQSELAEKLNISRPTIARWEDEKQGGLKGADSYALRALVGTHFMDIDPNTAERIFRSLKETPRGFPPEHYMVPRRDHDSHPPM
jgi:DNA-binding XRE family transcriptional regulator